MECNSYSKLPPHLSGSICKLTLRLPSHSTDIPWNPCPGKHAELQPDSKHLNGFPGFHCACDVEAERVPKTRQDRTCVAGLDCRSQNDAKEAHKARLPEAEREGLDASMVVGNTRRAQKSSRGSSREAEHVPKARQDPDCMAGRDFRGQITPKRLEKQGFQRPK